MLLECLCAHNNVHVRICVCVCGYVCTCVHACSVFRLQGAMLRARCKQGPRTCKVLRCTQLPASPARWGCKGQVDVDEVDLWPVCLQTGIHLIHDYMCLLASLHSSRHDAQYPYTNVYKWTDTHPEEHIFISNHTFSGDTSSSFGAQTSAAEHRMEGSALARTY